MHQFLRLESPASAVRMFVASLALTALLTATCPHDAVGQGIVVESASPSFSQPVSIRNAGDGSGRLFVVEAKTALIRWFIDMPASQASTFLDLSDRVDTSTGEEGLLGLAFHPDYGTNGYFYVNYTAANPSRTVVSRFEVSAADPNVADQGSELVLVEVDQPTDIHNGGDLAFGPDGYLYISLGDGGTRDAAQDRTNLLGTILRIDVDSAQPPLNYAIPAGNPFTGNVDGHREEIWAYGFRNPWRFSISSDGRVWVGDVGQEMIEEIDVVESGKNYGWPVMEGSLCFQAPTCDTTGLELPIHEYDRTVGSTVSGGYLYRGSSITLLGQYVFGDFGARKVFALDVDGSMTATHIPIGILPLISGFGEDESGELYLAQYGAGVVSRFSELLGIEIESQNPQDGPASAFQILPAYPNPSSGTFLIPFRATRTAVVTIDIVDFLGRSVRTIRYDVQEGETDLEVDLGNSAPGAYLLRVQYPGHRTSSIVTITR